MNIKNKKCIRRLSRRSLWASHKRNIIAIIAIALIPLLVRQKSSKVQGLAVVLSYAVYLFLTIV